MKTQILQKIVLIIAIFSCLYANAYDFTVDGIYYNRLSSDEVEVTIKEEHYDAYRGDVIVPQTVTYEGKIYTVTAIGGNAFAMCWKLTSVTLPNSIKTIGYYAFNGCSKLKAIDIPSNVTKIEYGAFSSCEALTSIVIPEGITKIESGLFSFCKNMKSVKLPSTITTIDTYAFKNCYALAHIDIPQGVTSIGRGAFLDCNSITSITIPNNVTTIEDKAFSGTGLTSVTIPSSVTTLHPNAFKDCPNLKSVILPDKNYKGEINGHEWVDLGLPSGTKWATCNVGASSPEDCGKYYSWGETKHKIKYEEMKSKTYGTHIGDISGKAEYDVARANWGGSWRMPTIDEVKELIKYCRWEGTTINGREGVKIISKTNYHYIFLPCAGIRINTSATHLNFKGFYWSSTPNEKTSVRAKYFDLNKSVSDRFLGCGLTVRPVTD